MRIITWVAVALLFIATAAQADELYAITGSNGAASTLYKLDKTDGSVIATIGATGFSHVTGIAFHPTTGVLYGVVSDGFGSGATQLITIDTTTGAGTLIGTTGFQIPDIAFHPDGTLYGWGEVSATDSPDDLLTINLLTGGASIVGDAGVITFTTGVGIDSAGNLFVKTSQNPGPFDVLLYVNPATGVPFNGIALDNPVANMLAFDANDVLYSGRRFGPQGSGGFTLYTITPGSPFGTVTALGSNKVGNISGIAFAPVPEPGAVLLLALGGLVIARRRRR